MNSPRFATVAEWLAWQEQLHLSEIDLGLTRLAQVFPKLFFEGYRKPITITVAGTNGKGSCVTTIATLLAAQGLSVGSFTSPHLEHYNERIRLNMQMVSDEELLEAFAAIDEARGDISLTYFEFNALAAFYVFNKHHVDVQVLEVGLGGRLDAVNLIDAHHCVITNIGLDHTDWLGDTRELIGAEKAGILRRHCQFVYGEADMPQSIIDRAVELRLQPQIIGQDFSYRVENGTFYWQGANQQEVICPAPNLPLPGVACALQILAELGTFDRTVIENVLPAIQLAGRMQRVDLQIDGQNKTLIFDVAHNPHGAAFLAKSLQAQQLAPATAIYSAMRDKDVVGTIQHLKDVVSNWLVFEIPNNPRAASKAQLLAALSEAGVAADKIHWCETAAQALAKAGERTLVFGSFYTVSEVNHSLS